MDALTKIKAAGFRLAVVGDRISVKPADKLTEQQRDFLKAHKAEVIAEIRAEQAVNEVMRRIMVCWTPAGTPIEVEARDDAHADFLRRMNPQPKQPNI
jgi:hypothetical protein